MTRKPLISGNWKMHHNHFEALQLVQKLSYLLTSDDYEAVDVSVHPPFTDLRTVQTYFISEKEPIPIALGAQTCHSEEQGAFTGEVSAAMLAKLDVRYVIAGHSERRELFGETDEQVNAKVQGDPQGRHDADPVLRRDARGAGGGVHRGQGHRPGAGGPGRPQRRRRWPASWSPTSRSGPSAPAARPAPRTPRPCAPWCARWWPGPRGAEAAAAVRIQYGGSVKPTNAAELMGQPDIDGALVGGASLDGRGLRPDRPVPTLNRHRPRATGRSAQPAHGPVGRSAQDHAGRGWPDRCVDLVTGCTG